jgi:microcystin-dependent protein
MPRNSSGAYSLPNGTLVSTGDTVQVSQHNPAMQDIEQALSGSLDRDGSGGMRANLVMGDNKITGLSPGTASTDAATVGQLQSGGGVPLGAVIDFWGSVPPEGFLFAYGQALSRTTYADLFAVIGTSAGVGDGATTFNLPDYRAVTSVGKANMGGSLKSLLSDFASSTLGAIFGAQSITLTSAQMPAHTHTVTDPGHAHAYTRPSGSGTAGGTGEFINNDSDSVLTGVSTTGITIASAGSGGAHANVQPSIVCNKIIKVTN